MTSPKGPGRPTDFSEEMATAVCEWLSSGETLADFCRQEGTPAVRTVSDWTQAHAQFSADFARARKDGFDAIAARARRTARGDDPDKGGDSTGDVQRDKLIIDTDMKLLAKWDHKRYGDRIQQEHSGRIEYANLSEEEIDARLEALMAKHGPVDPTA